MVGLFLVVMVGVLVAVVVSSIRRLSRLQPLWARAAADLGLPPPSGGRFSSPSISGRVDGRHLTVRERSGEDAWIEYELAILRGLPAGLTIRSEHLGSRMPVVGKLFSGGREQVDTGDDAFDRAFIVTGHDPDEVRAFLTDERRDVLVRLARECPDFELKNGELKYRFDGHSEKIGDLARPAHAMVAAARVLSPPSVGSAPHSGRAGDDATGAGQVFPGHGQPLPPPSAAPALVEPPGAAAAGAAPPVAAVPPMEGPSGATSAPAPAGVVFPVAESSASSEAASSTPVVDASTGIADDAERLDDVGNPVYARDADGVGGLPGASDAAVLGGGDSTTADQASALAAVFGVSAGAGAAVFEERLRGRRVRWSGIVERAGRYANDLDLGAGPGIRAVVDLGTVDTGDYGVARVAAVVAFPLDAVVVHAEPVAFEGTAASLDHFARRVVVTDASVVAG